MRIFLIPSTILCSSVKPDSVQLSTFTRDQLDQFVISENLPDAALFKELGELVGADRENLFLNFLNFKFNFLLFPISTKLNEIKKTGEIYIRRIRSREPLTPTQSTLLSCKGKAQLERAFLLKEYLETFYAANGIENGKLPEINCGSTDVRAVLQALRERISEDVIQLAKKQENFAQISNNYFNFLINNKPISNFDEIVQNLNFNSKLNSKQSISESTINSVKFNLRGALNQVHNYKDDLTRGDLLSLYSRILGDTRHIAGKALGTSTSVLTSGAGLAAGTVGGFVANKGLGLLTGGALGKLLI
jgi:hypothetical protein